MNGPYQQCLADKEFKLNVPASDFEAALRRLKAVKAFLDDNQARLTPADENAELRRREEACLKHITDEYLDKSLRILFFVYAESGRSAFGDGERKAEIGRDFFGVYDPWSKSHPQSEKENEWREDLKNQLGDLSAPR